MENSESRISEVGRVAGHQLSVVDAAKTNENESVLLNAGLALFFDLIKWAQRQWQ